MARERLSEADALMSAQTMSASSSVGNFEMWIKLAAMRGDHGVAIARLRAAQEAHGKTDWLPLTADIFMMARKYREALALIG